MASEHFQTVFFAASDMSNRIVLGVPGGFTQGAAWHPGACHVVYLVHLLT